MVHTLHLGNLAHLHQHLSVMSLYQVVQAMQVTVRLGDLGDDLQAHLDKIEAQTGYRPNKSEVVRDALDKKLNQNETSGSEPEAGAA